MEYSKRKEIINSYCLNNDLKSYDPYDVWKTKLGLKIKNLFNKNRLIGILPAAGLTLLDTLFNPYLRKLYFKQEFPIVRAQAAITCINIYKVDLEEKYLKQAKEHIDWLIKNSSKGYSGHCWGIGFDWPAGDKLVYDKNTPFTTHTPYVLEALHKYIEQKNDKNYIHIIRSIYQYYQNDVEIIHERNGEIGVSYGPMKDRLINNAVSYTLYAYSIFSLYIEKDKKLIENKINGLYKFLKSNQRDDGSWLYEPFNSSTFIDCFHSCFAFKNI